MSRLLIQEPPLQVLPSLAEEIGLNEAIVLQQIHYWVGNPKIGKMHDGQRWVRNSFDAWQETNFPFWSVRTLKRVMSSLVEKGLVIAKNLNAKTYDRTLWYTVDYEELDRLSLSIVTDCHDGEGQNGTLDSDNVSPPIPESLSENPSESLSESEDTGTNGFWDIPENINSKKFVKSWARWIDYVDERGLDFTETQAELTLEELSDAGEAKAVTSVIKSIRKGYKNVYVVDARASPNGDQQPAREYRGDEVTPEMAEKWTREYEEAVEARDG